MKKKKSNVDVFEAVKNAEAYSRAFKGLPDITSYEDAEKTVKKLDRLYQKYKKEKDKNGMLHCKVIAEIGENVAWRKGLYREKNLFSDWLKKIRNP